MAPFNFCQPLAFSPSTSSLQPSTLPTSLSFHFCSCCFSVFVSACLLHCLQCRLYLVLQPFSKRTQQARKLHLDVWLQRKLDLLARLERRHSKVWATRAPERIPQVAVAARGRRHWAGKWFVSSLFCLCIFCRLNFRTSTRAVFARPLLWRAVRRIGRGGCHGNVFSVQQPLAIVRQQAIIVFFIKVVPANLPHFLGLCAWSLWRSLLK